MCPSPHHSTTPHLPLNGYAPAPIRVLAYLRVSTQEQVQGTSLDSQRTALTTLCTSRGWPGPLFYSDDGISGADASRPALTRMLASLRPGDIVVCTAIDRLARSLRILLDIIEQVGLCGAAFHSIREGWDTSTPTGRFGLQLMGAASELERSLISSRTTEGRRYRQSQGQWAGGVPPLGYTRGGDGMLRIDPVRAETVRIIFDQVARGMSLRAVGRHLEAQGFMSPRGGVWHTGLLHRIRTESGYHTGTHSRTGSRMPPIVDSATWQRSERHRATAKRPARTGQPHPLQGRCALCGSSIGSHSGRKSRRHLFCRGREAGGRFRRTGERCTLPRQPAAQLERAALDALIATLDDPASFIAAVDVAIGRLREREQRLSRDTGPIEDELESVEETLRRVDRLYLDGRLSDEELDRRRREAERRRTGLRAQLDALGPDALADLERTRSLLKGAVEARGVAEWRRATGLPISEFTYSPYAAETDEHTEFREAGGPVRVLKTSADVADVLRDVLSRTHAEVFFHPYHLEIRGHLAVDVAYPDAHKARYLSRDSKKAKQASNQ
ncbi:MAG: recombinase family protein [Dehalococcoidia bacterium]